MQSLKLQLKIQNFKLLTLNFHQRQAGFGIIEIIIAMGIMLIIASTATITVLHSFSANRLGDEETEATLFAQEGIEAARSIANQGWNNLGTGTGTCAGSLARGVDNSSGSWAWTVSPQTNGKFARTVTINNVCRDISGDISDSGIIYDQNIKKITSTAAWNFSPTRSNDVTLITYLSDWGDTAPPDLTCDWSNPVLAGSYNFPSNNDGIKVQVQGDYAYITLTDVGNDPPYDFAILDITDPANPTLKGTLEGDGTLWNLAVYGDYVYLASGDNNKELQIIDISNPAAPIARGSYNAAGSRDAMGVYAIETTIYLVKAGDSANPEFFIINASDPDNPTLIGSADIGNNNLGGVEVWAQGNYAGIASEDQNKELKIVDISDPANPSYLSSGGYDIPGNNNANTIAGFDVTVVLGVSDDYLYFFDISDPLNVSLISSYQTDDDVNDLALGENNEKVFEASNNNVNDEFQVVDISDINNPISLGTYNFQIRLQGVAFDYYSCVVYIVGAPNVGDPEFYVIVPGGTPTPTPTPGPTPTPTPTSTVTPIPTSTPTATPTPVNCNEYCQQTYGLSGNCAKSKDCSGYNEGRIYECIAPNICCCE